MTILEILLNRRWILKSRDKELYYQVRDQLAPIKKFLAEKMGYQMVVNQHLIKVEKMPAKAQPWMGIQDFNDRLQYVFLCMILMFLEDKETEEQFVLSALTEYIQGHYKETEIDWTSYSNRRHLIKVIGSKIEEARKLAGDSDSAQSFHSIMREVLDYRKWFEFQLEYQKTGENKKELTDRAFFTFSGGEKAMAMYVPLFSAVVAKYAGARDDAPRIISLDEAFAGVDDMNIKDMFRLMVNFQFNFIINSQILWGDYETVPALAIYRLERPENARFVLVTSYLWNGVVRTLVDKMGD